MVFSSPWHIHSYTLPRRPPKRTLGPRLAFWVHTLFPHICCAACTSRPLRTSLHTAACPRGALHDRRRLSPPQGADVVLGPEYGPILHTGDFRYHDGLSSSQILKRLASAASTGERVQRLFLDMSCANVESLPLKAESVNHVSDLLDRHEGRRFFCTAGVSATKNC